MQAGGGARGRYGESWDGRARLRVKSGVTARASRKHQGLFLEMHMDGKTPYAYPTFFFFFLFFFLYDNYFT